MTLAFLPTKKQSPRRAVREDRHGLACVTIGLFDGQRTGVHHSQEVTELGSEPMWVEGREERQNLPGSWRLTFERAQLCFKGIAIYLQALGLCEVLSSLPITWLSPGEP